MQPTFKYGPLLRWCWDDASRFAAYCTRHKLLQKALYQTQRRWNYV